MTAAVISVWGGLCMLLLAGGALAAPFAGTCQPDAQRSDCGHMGTNQQQCEAGGCCWGPVTPNPTNKPWCFHQSGGPSPPPGPNPPPPPPPGPPTACTLQNNASTATPPFSVGETETMRGYFMANINIDGKGGVVASPDHNTGPGGDYYYHWERDGALSMEALQKTAPSFDAVKDTLAAYAKWVAARQHDTDPHGISVLTEPKYMLPDGGVYTGAWCRPQNDGPGLRAKTLIGYANALTAAGSTLQAQALWPTIHTDLDWVAANWQSQGCDLWEEIQSNDFFWNRFTMRAALKLGAKFAKAQNDATRAGTYSNAATAVEGTLEAHYNGQFVAETSSRQKDAAVICAFNDGYLEDGMFGPTSKEVAGTIATLNTLFCDMFPINQADAGAGIPGILYGRYEGDHYDGGNPWILLSAALAELLYRGASEIRTAMAAETVNWDQVVSQEAFAMWQQALGLAQEEAFEPAAMASAMLAAGDGVLTRIRHHVLGDKFHLAEQLEKTTGKATSATDLTWSYATVLKALHTRAAAQQLV